MEIKKLYKLINFILKCNKAYLRFDYIMILTGLATYTYNVNNENNYQLNINIYIQLVIACFLYFD